MPTTTVYVDAASLAAGIAREFPATLQAGRYPGPCHLLPLLGHVPMLRDLLTLPPVPRGTWCMGRVNGDTGILFEDFRDGRNVLVLPLPRN